MTKSAVSCELVTFTAEILNKKVYLLCSVNLFCHSLTSIHLHFYFRYINPRFTMLCHQMLSQAMRLNFFSVIVYFSFSGTYIQFCLLLLTYFYFYLLEAKLFQENHVIFFEILIICIIHYSF